MFTAFIGLALLFCSSSAFRQSLNLLHSNGFIAWPLSSVASVRKSFPVCYSMLAESPTSDEAVLRIERCKFKGKGCVLLAHKGEYDHHLMRAAILVFEHNVKGTMGIILDQPSAFTMGELVGNMGPLEANTLFLGGNDGADTAIMLHKYNLDGNSKPLGGGTGLYIGGQKEAKERVTNFQARPRDFKFFFNNVQWAPGLLEKEIEEGRWSVCRIPPDLILRQEKGTANTLWAEASNALLSSDHDGSS